ncbi:hypothetical protein XH86_13010 [Bradyrhizobium guangdongense]|uniref:Polysaccharide biosynthesis protein n=2 Tax=Bradyrhizobium guangdongense TaxID=1325090 RepID=A0ABX6UE12_9BRAD|nr:hypothetical protein X265_13010 [Bradyrhizobium guangdongense]QOZ59548.1 hypothetical protein XH86_13010 [Bradyrhizobium guangdongense]
MSAKGSAALPSFKARVLGAGSWTLLGHFLSLVLRFVGTLVLSRLFYPEIFGLLSIIAAVQMIITLLTDIGLRQAVVQSKYGDESSFLNTAWTVQVLRGFAIWSAGILISGGLWLASSFGLLAKGAVYNHPDLPVYIAVASASAALLGFQSMKSITASRLLQPKRLVFIDLTVQAAALVFNIAFGWLTRSIWAYIAGLIFSSAVTVWLTHAYLPGSRDRFGWNRSALRELLRFGRWTFASSALSAFTINGDRLLLGAWVAAPIMGYYSIAANLCSIAEGASNQLFGNVAFPALSEAARDSSARLRHVYIRMRWLTDPGLLFMAGFLFATGELLVSILYDPRYASAGWMLRYLSFGLVFCRYGISQSAFLALGRPDRVLAISCAKLISLFCFVPVMFFSFGLDGAVIGFAIHMLPVSMLILYFNWEHHLHSLRLEVTVLVAWSAGWLVGLGIVELLSTCCRLVR